MSVEAIASADWLSTGGQAHRYWRPASELPPVPTSAIVALLADDGEAWILSPALWHYIPRLGWQDEETGATLDEAEFLWMPEEALVGGLELPQQPPSPPARITLWGLPEVHARIVLGQILDTLAAQQIEIAQLRADLAPQPCPRCAQANDWAIGAKVPA